MLLRRFVLAGILIVLATRFLLLDRLPSGISHDEAEYVLSSASYAFNGTDLSGVGFPLSLIKTGTHGSISPIPPLLLAPYFYFVPITQFTARIPYVLISMIAAFVLYLLSDRLFKNKSLALVITLLFSVSPWGFLLSRWAADTPFALLFFLLGIYLALSESRLQFYSSFVLFILGFFSYNGAKILYLPLLILLLLYKWKLEKVSWFKSTQLLVTLAIVGLFIGGYFVISLSLPDSTLHSRESEIVFLNTTVLNDQVNYLREQSFASPYNHLFVNKFTVALAIIAEKYLTAFSPIPLFLTGDTDTVFRTNLIGLLPIYEIIAIVIGALTLWKRYKKEFLLLLGMLIFSPLATAVSGNATSLIQRSFLFLPVISIIAGVGIYFCYLFVARYVNYLVVAALWGGVIGLFFITFLHFYFFQWPMLSVEGFTLQSRLGIEYIKRIPKNGKSEVITTDNRLTYLQFVFFSDANNQRQFFNEGFDRFLKKDYSINKISFVDHCPEVSLRGTTYVIQRESSPCKRLDLPNADIVSQKDLKMLWQVHNDRICDRITLNKNKPRPTMDDLDFLTMTDERFCTTWLNSL